MKTHPTLIDVVIIGGGLAGLCSAIHLSKSNIKVLLIEKNPYPKHKVCGEYISNEVLPYLDFLGIDVFELGALKINRFQLSTPKNKLIQTDLPLGGFGISRYTLDHALAQKAAKQGVEIIQDTVTNVQFSNNIFTVNTKNTQFHSSMLIGAYGKRSNLDIKLNRAFIQQKSPFLAVKTHVKGDFPTNLVALHNFKGGYCGVSKVENDAINLCYITEFKTFKKYKDIDEFQEQIVFKNKYLKDIFKNSEPVFDTPLTISQISFAHKNPIENHMIMCGDTAGLIHPLCGNGMSMAIRGAQIASLLITDYFQEKFNSRTALETAYETAWNAAFKNRLRVGHLVSKIFSKNQLSEFLIPIVQQIPSLLPTIIKQTHGKPMTVS